MFFGEMVIWLSHFFILSGFVLSINYADRLNERSKINKYIAKRLFRIYPIYLVSLVFTLVVELLNHQTSSFYKIFINCILVQSWVTNSFDLVINHPSWSLSIEFFLYLIFPLLIHVYRKNRAVKVNLSIIGCITFIWQLLSMTGYIYAFPHALSWIFAFSIGIIWVLIFLNKQYNSTLVFIIVGLSLIFSIAYGIVNFWNNIAIFCFGVGFFIFLISSLASKLSTILGMPVFLKLGEISFSIYILQFPLRMWFRKIFLAYHIHLGSFKEFILFYITLCILSLFAYECLEKPMKQKLENIFLK